VRPIKDQKKSQDWTTTDITINCK